MKYLTILLVVMSLGLRAQMTVTPAPTQTSPMVLTHGTIHVGDGRVIEDGTLAFVNGKITYVGASAAFSKQELNWKEIECRGQHIYPGFIAANNMLGLVEIELVRSTLDYNEVGEYNANVRSLIAYNTDSKIIPTVRTNGILLTEPAPQGGVISGSSSVMMLDGWNWEDAAYKTDIGIHLSWPATQSTEFKNGQANIKANEEYIKQVAALRDFFNSAKSYLSTQDHSLVNVCLESMKGIFDGSRKVFIHADGAKEIGAAIDFAKELSLNMVIVGGRESWMMAGKLKSNHVPVMLGSTHNLPRYAESDVDQPYKTAKLLHDAGVLFAIAIPASWQVRNLPFVAGTAAAYGLTAEEALQTITINAATILGINATAGTLEAGKDAILFVSTGNALDMMSNKLTYAWIRGRQIDLVNQQEKLYDTYKAKYGLDK